MSAPTTLTREQAIASLGAVPTATGFKCQGWEGPCEREDAQVRRQNTRYVDDCQNWVCLCPDCMKANRAHWDDMWSDYYAGCM